MTRDAFLPASAQPQLADYVDLARRAEALGYERVWVPETWGRDAVTVLAAVAERTESIGVGTSVLPVYTRSPALLGQTAAALQELSEGRVRLGVGPSGPALMAGWHGVPFERPLRRTRETVEIVKAVCAGGVVDYDGEVFQLTGFRLRSPAPDPPPAVDAAGMGPKAVELAGRFADGWHGLMLTRDGLRERLDDFRRGVELGEGRRADRRVTIAVPCCALDDGDRARALARQHLAFYVGAMGTFYRDSLARQGWDEVAHEVAARWGSGDPEAAMAAIPDELLDDLGAVGTPEHALDGLERFEAIEGVDAVSVSFPGGAMVEDMTRTMEALAP